jgi:Holliday junction resolvase RusA-like endonuclease
MLAIRELSDSSVRSGSDHCDVVASGKLGWLQGIPVPPSLNNSYPTNRQTGRRYKSPDLKAWEADFQTWALANKPQILSLKRAVLTPKENHVLAIHCMFYFEWSRLIGKEGRPKKIDVDNRLKHLNDWLAKLLGIDDCSFFKIVAEKYPVVSSQIQNTVDVKLSWEPVNWFTPWSTKQ